MRTDKVQNVAPTCKAIIEYYVYDNFSVVNAVFSILLFYIFDSLPFVHTSSSEIQSPQHSTLLHKSLLTSITNTLSILSLEKK